MWDIDRICMEDSMINEFYGCYKMQQADIERFAETLADGFSGYALFEHVCNGKYSYEKMKAFWKVSVALVAENAICISDSAEANSVLVYIPPKSKEPGLFSYLKAGGAGLVFKLGIRSTFKLLRFDVQAQRAAKRYRKSNDGYLMAFATRKEKQGRHYGKPLVEALLKHLQETGEGCYLETLKASNVELYSRFSFQLMEQAKLEQGNLTLFSMRRSGV